MCYTTLIDTPDQGATTVELPGPRRAHFTTTKRGLLPTALLGFMKERARVKHLMQVHPKDSVAYKTLDSRQQAIKTVNNSFYGLLGSSLPFGCEIIAESVTAFGRTAVQKAQHCLERNGYPVRLMDTDSCGIELPASMSVDDVSTLCKLMAKNISKEEFDGKLSLEYEKQLRPCLIFMKKMYAGFDPSADDLLIKGLSAKRRGVMPFVRQTLQNVLQLLCCSGDIEAAIKYVATRFTFLLELKECQNLEDFTITSAIKHFSEYKATPSLGYRVNQKLPQPLGPGERIRYTYYFDKTDPKHNSSKKKGKWMPGTAIDTALPIDLMVKKRIDVYRVLQQHEKELLKYFRTVSVHHASRFEKLYLEAIMAVKTDRGCSSCKNYHIVFLNLLP